MSDRDREPTGRVATRPPPPLDGHSGLRRSLPAPAGPAAQVLVVGGPQEEASFMAMALRRRYHAVRCVRTASEALELLQRERFDVVVARDVLPDAKAAALFGELRRRDPRVRTILLHDGNAQPVACVDEALRRPVPVVALVQTVERLLG